jgi:hypothetical protein
MVTLLGGDYTELGRVAVPRTRYQVRVTGRLDAEAREAFGGLTVEPLAPAVVLSGDLDQAALLGLIDRVRALGLELVEVRRIRCAS